ncbi:hypothetical protein EW145_g1501 [Phellinidium pouzarii]|uniref:RecF/RecN/SMC N-terminal domain-containing protein n=1 Tax=Phellinidium pouzarii TaxID=167371 RepID=A0A4S4LG68_9AGAM|nr:hypothetical protein EW145_g1501 [Phellinidium pouzarii]
MVKRRASGTNGNVVSDAEETPSKRARVDDDEIREEETEEQKDFEARFGDKVRASIESKTKIQGRVAELGIIQSLEMHQFMCHPRLSFTFGPQINFIIGHNGSGKSAVLSAITVALGSKAATTGRGTGIKSFIREGQSAAEVTITIKNEGDDAYRPDAYGKSIVITRRFTKEGSSSYKIKSKDGKTISTKKEELSAICDHMNIQVDNPMNILSQDSARQFLSASKPTEKYEFFLKGTQLKQLSEEYEACLDNIGKTFRVLETKRGVLPDLKKAVADATTRFKGARKAMETKAKIGELKQELAWSHVQEKEEEMKAKIEEVAKMSRKVPKLQDCVSASNAKLEAVNETISRLTRELEELGNIGHLTTRKAELNEQMRANKQKLHQYQMDSNRMNSDMKGINTAIEQFEARIAAETKKLQDDKQAEREGRQRKLDEAKKNVNDHEAQLIQVNDQLRVLTEEQNILRANITETEKAKNSAEQEMVFCGRQLNQIAQQAQDRLPTFGANMAEVLRRIDASQWCGEKPVGPVGLYVSLRDQQWANVMRATLGNMMTSFAVTDARDRNTLKRILESTGNHSIQVIVSERDLFDYSGGEPPENVLTVLRALKFTDEYVKRIFINQNRIERTFLASTRREGEHLAESLGGGTAWTADLMRVMAYKSDGGYYSQPLQELHYRDNRMNFFGHEDPEREKQQWKERGRQADGIFREATAKLEGQNARLTDLRNALEGYNNEAKTLNKKLFGFKQHLRALQDEINEDMPVNIGALEEAKRNEVLKAADERNKAKSDLDYWNKKLAESQKKVQELEDAAQGLQEEYENWTKSAEDFCDGKRVDNPRKKAEIDRKLKSVEFALAEQQKENGATVEELEEALTEAKLKLKNTERDLKDMANLNKVLKQSVVYRLTRWYDFRRHIALRTKLQFQYHLANRAYFGKVLFDHDNQKLELKVQTDDQAATQGLNKDPKSLSGGEKSFSTICLLLALWEAIGCPIRCLDEFDVFMDAVNRRISMRMMIDTANASDSKQYILITPQDMSNVPFGPSVRVHRMGDPERGQAPLVFRS